MAIDQLKSLISKKSGVADPTLFRVFLPPISPVSSEEINLLCTNVNLPGRQIMTQEKKLGLISQKYAYDQAYDDVNMTFRVLNDYGIRKYFERWQDKAINQRTLEVGYLKDYTFDVKIQQIKKSKSHTSYASTQIPTGGLPPEISSRLPDVGPFNLSTGQIDLGITSGDVVYECTLKDAFPTTLNAIELGDGNTNRYIELSIQLSYKNWESKDSLRDVASDALDEVLNTGSISAIDYGKRLLGF